MHLTGRILFVAALLFSPWPFGCVTSEYEWLLCLAVCAFVLWRLAETIFSRPEQPLNIPLVVIAPVGLLVLASVQLLPRAHSPVLDMEHAVFAEWADSFSADTPASGSVAPVTTRGHASRLFFVLAAFLLATQWFSTPASQIWLWRVLVLNGAVLGFFGIVQKVTWNGFLFWSVPLRFGGTPFASYVNRNNAAGYLNLCLAAGLGWFFFQYGARFIRPSMRDRRGRPRLPGKVRVLRTIATIDGPELGLMGLLAVVAAAVLFSLSRGGILAMIVGLGVALWWHRGLSRTAAVLVVLLLGAGAAGLMLSVGGWGAVESRLTSLSDTVSAAEGRLHHWRDTSAAVIDFPLLGTGLGTYRYANLPYQRHQGQAWYVHADNHYFEMLVETGVIGLALFLCGFVLTGLAAGFLVRNERPELRAVGMMGLFAVVSQGIHAMTDFGLLIPANALTFAVVAGSVCGTACTAAGFERIRLPVWLSVARLEGRVSQLTFSLALTLVSAAFALEMFAATQSATARSVTVTINPAKPQDTRDKLLETAIEDAEAALRFRPDDPELHRAIALWWISRYRLGTARELQDSLDPALGLRKRRLWNATSLSTLNVRILELAQRDDRRQADAIRALPRVQDYLVPARKHLLEASRCGPLTRDVSENLAHLAFLTDNTEGETWQAEMAQYSKQTLFVTPSAPDTLFTTAVLADSAGRRSIADRSYARCLRITDKHLMPIWRMTSPNRPLADLVDSVLPPRVDILVSLAERISDEPVKNMLALRAEQLRLQEKEEDAFEPSFELQARLAELRGRNDQAIELYRMALSDDPWNAADIESRLRIAQLLREQGRLSESESEFSLLRRLAPDRSDIHRQYEALRLRDLEPPRGKSNERQLHDP